MGSTSTEMEAHGPHASSPPPQGKLEGRQGTLEIPPRKKVEKAWTPPPMRRRCNWPAWPTNCRTETRTPSSPPSLRPLHSSMVVADPKVSSLLLRRRVQLGVAALLLRLRRHLLPQGARQGRVRSCVRKYLHLTTATAARFADLAATGSSGEA
jgi:hypothetical protein